MLGRGRLPVSFFLACATICGASARGSKPHAPKEFYQQLLAAKVACDAADKRLLANMQQAGEVFSTYCQSRGFPRTSRELSTIENALYSIANTNPYAKDPMLAREVETNFPQARTRVSVEVDGALSEASVMHLSQFPPESWHAVPGSFTIVHNNRDMFMIWAAGIDGKPLKDKDEHMHLVYGRVYHR